MFNFAEHDSKGDRYHRSHDHDTGYELGSALAVDPADDRHAARRGRAGAGRRGDGGPGPAGATRHRPEDRRLGQGAGGDPLPPRLVVTRVVGDLGTVLAEWRLFTDVPAEQADASTIGRWYTWRWKIRTYHELLKSAGMNVER